MQCEAPQDKIHFVARTIHGVNTTCRKFDPWPLKMSHQYIFLNLAGYISAKIFLEIYHEITFVIYSFEQVTRRAQSSLLFGK